MYPARSSFFRIFEKLSRTFTSQNPRSTLVLVQVRNLGGLRRMISAGGGPEHRCPVPHPSKTYVLSPQVSYVYWYTYFSLLIYNLLVAFTHSWAGSCSVLFGSLSEVSSFRQFKRKEVLVVDFSHLAFFGVSLPLPAFPDTSCQWRLPLLSLFGPEEHREAFT